jgi:hypothetical protein
LAIFFIVPSIDQSGCNKHFTLLVVISYRRVYKSVFVSGRLPWKYVSSKACLFLPVKWSEGQPHEFLSFHKTKIASRQCNGLIEITEHVRYRVKTSAFSCWWPTLRSLMTKLKWLFSRSMQMLGLARYTRKEFRTFIVGFTEVVHESGIEGYLTLILRLW